MTTKQKILSAAGILLLISLIVWTVRTIPNPPAKEESKEPHVMTYDGNTLKEEADGRVTWELTAESISINADTQDAEMQNLKGKFYEKDGTVVDVKADHGSYQHASKNVIVDTNIEIKTTAGSERTCQTLMWVAEREMLAAEGDAHIKKADMRGNADRIESTDGFNRIKLIGKAHIERGVKDENK